MDIIRPSDPITNLPDLADELDHFQSVLSDMLSEWNTTGIDDVTRLENLIDRARIAEAYVDDLITTLARHMQGAAL